jgi:hypothetical protein
VKSCLRAIRETGAVKGLAHITGGGFTDNIPRVLPKHLGVGIDLAMPLPGAEQVEVGANAGVKRSQGDSVMISMRLKPSGNASVPNDLVWLPHEPLWQEVVDARLTSGLLSFNVDVRSHDDYGVTANLKAKIAKSGLEAGGSFVEHRATWWRLTGTFSN